MVYLQFACGLFPPKCGYHKREFVDGGVLRCPSGLSRFAVKTPPRDTFHIFPNGKTKVTLNYAYMYSPLTALNWLSIKCYCKRYDIDLFTNLQKVRSYVPM